MITVRPFTPADYAGMVAVNNAADPDYPFTVEEFQSRDARRPANMIFARWVACDAHGEIVGVVEHDQRPDQYHVGKWIMRGGVHPDARGRGIGTGLIDTLEAALQKQNLLSVRAFAREDCPRDVAFLTRRGYSEVMRDGGASLRLADVDTSDALRLGAAAHARGITIKTLPELEADPDRDAKLCELGNALIADIPPLGERTAINVEMFRTVHLSRPDIVPDAFLVAVTDNGEYVGQSTLRLPPDRSGRELHTGITGVRREWRQRGIALALKWRNIEYARNAGAERLRTWNASDNEPVLALNRKLGFVREPWRIHFVKNFASETYL